MMSNSKRIPYAFADEAILPFWFHPDSMQFIVGTTQEIIPPANVLDAFLKQDDALPADALSKLRVGFTQGNTLLTGPLFKKYVITRLGGAVVRGTGTVMAQVYEQLIDGTAIESEPQVSFTANRQKNGNIEMGVYDNPAKITANPFGKFVKHHEWLTGYGQYNAVDINRPQTLIALYAGMGYIAHHAQQSA